MTVLDACVEIFKWFQKNHSFEVEKDFKKIFLISENQEVDKATLLAALDSVEKQKIITKVELDGSPIYVLNRPLASLEQDVKIDYETATKVSEVINKFCHTIDDHKDVSDPLLITQKDIFNLAILVEALQEEVKS
tara:strand:+ start:280 stop:684 length:405 start_codon:yes stop_codon:yes gene_type:complete